MWDYSNYKENGAKCKFSLKQTKGLFHFKLWGKQVREGLQEGEAAQGSYAISEVIRRKRACKGRRPAMATESGPEPRAGRASPLTTLHLKFLMPPLQAIDLGLLVGKELFKFVLDGLRKLVKFRALQDLLQHRRHVDVAGGRGASGRRSKTGEERRRPRGPRSLGARLDHLAPGLARACPPETPAAGPWEIESCVRRRRTRHSARARSARAAAGRWAPWVSEFRGGLWPGRALRFPAPQSTRFKPHRPVGNVVFFFFFLNPFGEPDCAPPIPLPLFSPPPGSPQAVRLLSARWRHGVFVNSRPSLKSQATLPSKLRDAMGRPLWRLLDTKPLEGIGPNTVERQAPGYRHALNGARKGAGWRPQSLWLRCCDEGRGAACVISMRHLTPETLGLEWEVRCGKSVAFWWIHWLWNLDPRGIWPQEASSCTLNPFLGRTDGSTGLPVMRAESDCRWVGLRV